VSDPSPEGATLRVFVAVPLIPSIRTALESLIAGAAGSTRDVRWVDKDNLHITIKFLGDTLRERIPEVSVAVATACLGVPAFDLLISGIGAFPPRGAPKVIWAGVSRGGGHLAELAGRVDAALAELGFERERRPFSPHVTIGRVRSSTGSAVGEIRELLGAADGFVAGGQTVDEVTVMRSELRPQGPVYTRLATASLKGSVPGLPDEDRTRIMKEGKISSS
jgi:2'-5' RNA ligase